ncbi:unnamed protein product [Peniophora sp. CBMAI 1063]|nr:unnamed protein product [Peniophora sp. CBMAI 1063]
MPLFRVDTASDVDRRNIPPPWSWPAATLLSLRFGGLVAYTLPVLTLRTTCLFSATISRSRDFTSLPMASLDLQGASDLGSRLSFMNTCHDASVELLEIIHDSSDVSFERQARKIITLIEIARSTLTRGGLKLHSFASCPPALTFHKQAYFMLLEALRDRRHLIDDNTLKERAARLLLPLSSGLVIRRRSMSVTSDGRTPPPDEIGSDAESQTLRRTAAPARRLPPAPPLAMPPPAALPSKDASSPASYEPPAGGEPPLWRVERLARTRSRPSQKHLPPAEGVPGDDTPPVIYTVQRVRPHRYGIFCSAGSANPSIADRQHNRLSRNLRA